MLFNIISAPAIFTRNADILLETLKFVDKIWFNYFDNIFLGASSEGEEIWIQLIVNIYTLL